MLKNVGKKIFRERIINEDFLDAIQKNIMPMNELMAYYRCAIMEVETKFNVLNEEFSLQYDRNPIENVKSRLKSTDSIIRKLKKKELPFSLEAMQENINDVAGIRVICSFPEDIYMLADCFSDVVEKK